MAPIPLLTISRFILTATLFSRHEFFPILQTRKEKDRKVKCLSHGLLISGKAGG